jgi:hypothetical protein
VASKATFKALNDAFIVGGYTEDSEYLTVETLSGWGTLSILVEANNNPDQASADWIALIGQDLNTGTSAATAVTAAGSLKRYDVSGLCYVRIRCSAFTSGTGVVGWSHGKGALRA